jgi:chromosome segregation ATPase
MQIRHTLAAAAVSAVALGGVVAAPASADVEPACVAAEAAVTDAKTAKTAARQAFTTYRHTPRGKLIKAERAEARVEARQSRRELRSLVKELDKAERRELRQLAREIRAVSRELAKANRQQHSNRAVMVEVNAQRRALRQAWLDAKVGLREARQALRECEATEETTTDEGTVTTQGKED